MVYGEDNGDGVLVWEEVRELENGDVMRVLWEKVEVKRDEVGEVVG